MAFAIMIMIIVGNPYQIPLVESLGKVYSNNLLVCASSSTPPAQLIPTFQVIFNRRLHIAGGRNPPDSDHALYQSTPKPDRTGDTTASGMFHIHTGRSPDAISVHQEVWSDSVPLGSMNVGRIQLSVIVDLFDVFKHKSQTASKGGSGGLGFDGSLGEA